MGIFSLFFFPACLRCQVPWNNGYLHKNTASSWRPQCFKRKYPAEEEKAPAVQIALELWTCWEADGADRELLQRHFSTVKWDKDPHLNLSMHQMPPLHDRYSWKAACGQHNTHKLFAKIIQCVLLLAALKHPQFPIWDCNGKKRNGVWHCPGKLNTSSPPWYVLKLQSDRGLVFLFLLLVANKAKP